MNSQYNMARRKLLKNLAYVTLLAVCLRFKGICKVSQKVVLLMTLLCNFLSDWGISFDEISVSLYCCITGLWHPINMKYVFKDKSSSMCLVFYAPEGTSGGILKSHRPSQIVSQRYLINY